MPAIAEGRRMEATLFADGGSRGNPGPAASAAVLLDPNGETIEEVGACLGIATNNVAEWTALVLGLQAARKRGIRRLERTPRFRARRQAAARRVPGQARRSEAALPTRARQLLRDFSEVRHQARPAQAERARGPAGKPRARPGSARRRQRRRLRCAVSRSEFSSSWSRAVMLILGWRIYGAGEMGRFGPAIHAQKAPSELYARLTVQLRETADLRRRVPTCPTSRAFRLSSTGYAATKVTRSR